MNVVLIVPAAVLDRANRLGQEMGWGPTCYTVGLSPTGKEPATHWGLNLNEAQPDFLAMLDGAGKGEMPARLVDGGYSPSDFSAVLSGLQMWMDTPFSEVAAMLGLRVTGAE